MPIEAVLSALGSSFLLVFLAEFGDKSQLVCMTLSARHKPLPVLAGTMLAFSLLNLLAVIFGAAIARWVPELWIAIAVALLFAFFAIQSWRDADADEDEEIPEIRKRSMLLMSFTLIFMAELGDKTQLAVAGLSSTFNVLGVWLGSTLALFATSALGVWLGGTLLKKLSMLWLHRMAATLFMLMAILAAWRAVQLLS